MQTLESQPLVRKQIMLSNENLEKLAELAEKEKSSVAHVVRKAIDSYEPNAFAEDVELRELIALLNDKLDTAIADTERTHACLSETLNNLSSRKEAK